MSGNELIKAATAGLEEAADTARQDARLALPFAHLNLRCNPFGALLPAERARLAVIAFDLEQTVQRLRQPGHAIQFTGRQGRGKSTHLQAIRACFPGAPFTYVPRGGRVPEVPDTPVQVIDEMQRIPFRRRRRILRRRASFVIGSHWNHWREYRRTGLTYELYSLKGLNLDKLMTIINKRITWAMRDPGRPLPSVSKSAAANLIATYGDDIRAIENHLYECFQAMVRPEALHIDAPTLRQRSWHRLGGPRLHLLAGAASLWNGRLRRSE